VLERKFHEQLQSPHRANAIRGSWRSRSNSNRGIALMNAFRSIEDRVRAIAELATTSGETAVVLTVRQKRIGIRLSSLLIETPPSLIRELSPVDIEPGERATGGFMAPYRKTYG